MALRWVGQSRQTARRSRQPAASGCEGPLQDARLARYAPDVLGTTYLHLRRSTLVMLAACSAPAKGPPEPPPQPEPAVPVAAPKAWDPAWVWVGTASGLAAYGPDGTPVTWSDGTTVVPVPDPVHHATFRGFVSAVDTAAVDPERGRVVRQVDGHLEAWSDGSLVRLGDVDGEWTLDHDGSVWVWKGGRTERWSLEGARSPGPELPEGYELLGVTRGTVCGARYQEGAHRVDVVCRGGEEHERTFGTTAGKRSCRVTWAQGLVHHSCGPLGFPPALDSLLWDPTSGELVHEVTGQGLPAGPEIRVHSATTVWTERDRVLMRGAWSGTVAAPDGSWFDGPAVAVSADGRQVVQRLAEEGEKHGTDALLLSASGSTTRLGTRARAVLVVSPAPSGPSPHEDWPELRPRR